MAKNMPISNETPRGAIDDILKAVNNRDYEKLTSRVDLTEFINLGYDEAIDQLALNCDRFHQKYPDDLLFQYGAQAIRDYNARYRLLHIGYIFAVVQTYFGKKINEPPPFSTDPIGFSAYHFGKLIKALKASIADGTVEDDAATVTIEVTAKGDYKELIGRLPFQLGLKMIDGRWRVIKVENVAELVEPILDIGEKIWPREWDRGIRL